MNILDIGVVLILLMFIIVGFKHGVIRELVSFLGIILIFYLAFFLRKIVGNILCLVLPFIKFSGGLEGLSAINLLLYHLIAFILVFSILLSLYIIMIKVSKFLQKIVNFTIVLWLPSKLLGGLVGLIEGYIVMFLLLLLLIIPLSDTNFYEESIFANKIVYNTPVLSDSVSSITKSINEIYILVDNVSKKSISSNSANVKIVNILLRHNVVSKSLVINLVNNGKLNNVVGIDKILENY